MKQIIYISLIFFCTQSIFSQIVDKPEMISKVKKASEMFLVEKKELNITNNTEKFHIKEVVEKTEIGYTLRGIYRLFTNKSPSYTYIIIKDEDKFLIIDLYYFSDALKAISTFLSTGFDDKTIVDYMEEVIKIYNYNRYDEKIKM